MKKIFLTVGMFIFSVSVLSQKLINLQDLVGYWEPNDHATHIVMWFDSNNEFQLIEFTTTDYVPLTLISMMIVGDKLKVKARYDENNWESEAVYSFIDKQTLKCEITNKYNKKSIVIYDKVK